MEQNEILDCLVVGAGISGITAAIYLSRSSLKFKIIDKGAPGGKLNNVHLIKNYPGYSSVSGPDLSMQLFKQLLDNHINVDYAEVRGVSKQDDCFAIHTDMGEIYSKTIIAATGMNFPKDCFANEKKYLGKGLSYCATCDGPLYKGKNVAVIGKNSRSKEEAIYLSSICKKVYFVCPEESDLNELVKYENIEVLKGYKPAKLNGDGHIESVSLNKGEEVLSIEVEAVFPLLGEVPSLSFLSSFLISDAKGFAIVNQDCLTRQEGIYVVGDAVSKRLKQAVNAASEGAIAATSVIALFNKRR